MYVRARDGYTCQYCGVVMPPDLEVDHIIPRSRGGTDRPDNLVAACHDCNRRKGNLTAAEFGHRKVQAGVRCSLRAAAHTQAGKTATLKTLTEIGPVETTYTVIVVEHKDRLTRFGFRYIETLLGQQGRRVEVVNLADNGREDLLDDLVAQGCSVLKPIPLS